jgi:F-type H+-transporting ATPase subunit c
MGVSATIMLGTLTSLGEGIGFGLAIGLGALGVSIGVAVIFSTMIQSAARQPEARPELQGTMWLGFALTEAVIFYALLGAILLTMFV